MTTSTYEHRLQHFSSDRIPAGARLDLWRDTLSRKLIPAVVDELDAPLRCEAFLRALPGIRFGWAALSPTVHARTRDVVSHDNDDFFFVINLDGLLHATQSRRELVLQRGEAMLLACSELGSYHWPKHGNLLCFRLPNGALTGAVPDAYDRIARVIPPDVDSLKLLASYSHALGYNQALATPELRKLAVTHLYDLIALSLGASHDAGHDASERSLGPARLGAIKTFIAGSLTRPALSIGDVANHHRLSPRQVQRLFESTGTTFSEHVQRERLSLVYMALVDPEKAKRSIGEIVFDCGFGDVSHFNRAFRRRYGVSPLEVRRFELSRDGKL
ncbi:MAG TPA: AraC family transcriptional regulator [Rhizomicrobium sp.]|jgi:AraC-like DNA-binding protein